LKLWILGISDPTGLDKSLGKVASLIRIETPAQSVRVSSYHQNLIPDPFECPPFAQGEREFTCP
jgi:hypothetical protein